MSEADDDDDKQQQADADGWGPMLLAVIIMAELPYIIFVPAGISLFIIIIVMDFPSYSS